MNNILVLCFLGDPTLEPASVEGTGGFNVDSKELVQILSETKYNVTFITNYSFPGQPSVEELASNIKLYRIKFIPGSLQNQNLLKEQVDKITKEVIKLSPPIESIFVIHSLYWFSGYISYKISSVYHIPFIYTPVSLGYNKTKNGVALKCTCQEEWENIFLPKAALIFAITYSEGEILSEHYNVSPSRIAVVGRIASLSRNIVSKEQYDKFEKKTHLSEKSSGILFLLVLSYEKALYFRHV